MNTFLHTPKCLTTLLLLVLFCHILNAQPVKKFNSKSYSVNEGLLNSHVLDMVEDANGFLWISTGLGLQRFDGSTFETIPPQQGLLQTNDIYFFKLSNGNIWLRYESGISVYNIVTNKFQLLVRFSVNNGAAHQNSSLLYTSSFVMPLVEIKDNVWCRDLQKNFICINKFSGKIADSLRIPEKLQPTSYRYKKANDNTVFFDASGNTIVQIDFTTKQIKRIYRPDPASVILTYTPINDTDLIITTDKGIYKTNTITGDILLSKYPGVDFKNMLNRSVTHLSDNLFALSLNNELFILNAQNGKILYRMVDKQNNSFISGGYINKCITDRYNHLWIMLDTAGLLKKIDFNNLKFKYYSSGDVQENFSTFIYPDKKYNIIITGSLFDGFSVFDTSQHLIKHFKLKPWEQTRCILKTEPYKYLLFTNGHPGIYLFNAKNFQLTTLNKNITKFFTSTDAYFTYVQPLTDTTAALFCNNTVFIIHHTTTKITFTQLPIQKTYSSAIADDKKRLWLGETGKYFILSIKNFVQGTPFGIQEKIFYLPQNTVTKCFYQDKEKNMWMGTEKGLYKLNSETGAIMRVWQKKDGLANDSVYSIIQDDKGSLWCGTNKGISAIDKTGKIINIYTSDGLQSDEFNTNNVAKADDGELLFGGVNGVNSFYPDSVKNLVQETNILISNIKIMDQNWHHDTALWNLKYITLSYTQNVISFYFTALGWHSSDEYIYQYKMTGIDKSWINAGNHGYARYILPPGKYIFEYTAGSETDKNIVHKKYIAVTITPPFWQTAWFIILISLCAIIIIIVIVNFYYKKMQRQKLRQLEIQQTLQQERQRISRDLHDNIGAYTTVLLAGVEKLQQQATEPIIQQSAQNVSENARNIIGSLQETIWVLNKDVITITDFIDRFKLYAKKILQHFPDVQIKFKEQLDKDFELSPAEALHIFRIMQEALQNSLKHGKSKNIIVSVHSNETIYISVKDDGKGFDKKNIIRGHGLHNIQHRAREAGYELNIFSDEQGTDVTLQKNKSFAV